MDDKDRKMLTEWLNECWHDKLNDEYECDKCGEEFGREVYNERWCQIETRPPLPHSDLGRRTFTALGDFFAVKNRLVELGLWVEFYMWAWDNWFETGPEWWSAGFACWLIDPTRFCQLAADFLKERGENG